MAWHARAEPETCRAPAPGNAGFGSPDTDGGIGLANMFIGEAVVRTTMSRLRLGHA
jgi:hypothetical protein